jgi:hypothetical protein
MVNFEFFKKRRKEQRSYEIFYDGFGEVCDFFCDEESYGDSEDIIGLDEREKLGSDTWVGSRSLHR